MRIRDAYVLARTKRKTRRIRTVLVMFVSALLFALLFFGAFGATGLENAARQVKTTGFNGRYLTEVTPKDSVNSRAVGLPAIQKRMDDELRARDINVDDTVRQQPAYVMEL